VQAIAITMDLAGKYDGIDETNSFSLLFSLLAGNMAENLASNPEHLKGFGCRGIVGRFSRSVRSEYFKR
jgi:hypothetical protein